MHLRPSWPILFPLLAPGLILALAVSAQAQDRHDQAPDGASAQLQVNIGAPSHWVGVRGTDIEELPAGERPNFDVFRTGGTYYAHFNNRWFMSRLESGSYTAMDDRDVPSGLSNVPRDHWQNYPSGWQERQGHRPDAAPDAMQINLSGRVHWGYVRGSRVQQVRESERPDYDVFRYSGSYYVYANRRWYSSRYEHGLFAGIDPRAVPSAVYRVPSRYWHDYPSSGRGVDRRDRGERAAGYDSRDR